MIWRFSITVLVTIVLLTFKAYFDVKRQKEGIYTEHGFEWLMLAGIILNIVFFSFGAYWYKPFFWQEVIADLIFLLPISWTYFDLVHNLFAGEKLSYISPPSVHQSISDKFLTFVIDGGWNGWQYVVKGAALFIAVLIDLIILTV